jgi:hypothetical protein
VPVDLRAEHDHVRHHVEPNEQHGRSGQRLHHRVVLGEADERGQELEGRLEHDRGDGRAREHLAPAQVVVREHDVGGREEDEHAGERDRDRDRVRQHRAVADPRVALQDLGADRADHERDEQEGEQPEHQHRRQRLPAQERTVRTAVDDVERALEHGEERQRRPREEGAAEDAERGRVLAHATDRVQERVERRARKGAVQLAHEERAFVRLADRTEERERQKEQRDERQKREVRDHRGEMRAAVGEELADDRAYGRSVCSAAWMRPRRSPT